MGRTDRLSKVRPDAPHDAARLPSPGSTQAEEKWIPSPMPKPEPDARCATRIRGHTHKPFVTNFGANSILR